MIFEEFKSVKDVKPRLFMGQVRVTGTSAL